MRILVIADDLSGAAELTGIGARHGLGGVGSDQRLNPPLGRHRLQPGLGRRLGVDAETQQAHAGCRDHAEDQQRHEHFYQREAIFALARECPGTGRSQRQMMPHVDGRTIVRVSPCMARRATCSPSHLVNV